MKQTLQKCPFWRLLPHTTPSPFLWRVLICGVSRVFRVVTPCLWPQGTVWLEFCEPSFPLQHSSKFVQVCPSDCFLQVPFRGNWNLSRIGQNSKTVIFGQIFDKFQSPWMEASKTIAGTSFGQTWGSRRFWMLQCRGKEGLQDSSQTSYFAIFEFFWAIRCDDRSRKAPLPTSKPPESGVIESALCPWISKKHLLEIFQISNFLGLSLYNIDRQFAD